jgi:hypothetical protein
MKQGRLDHKGAEVKRSRRGGRRPQSPHGGHTGGVSHNGGGNGSGGHNPNRTFDSAGPEVKIRGSAAHVYEKYLQLARDANTMGDRVTAENYLQHAEHYFRILAAAQAQQQQYQQNQPVNGTAQPEGYRPPNGAGEQPFIPGGPAVSEPSFSLADAADEGDQDDDSGNR